MCSTTDTIILKIQKIIDLNKDHDFLESGIVVEIDWIEETLCLSYSVDASAELYQETMFFERNGEKRGFLQDVYSKLRQLALTNLQATIILGDSNNNDEPVFVTHGCATVLDKVIDLQKKKKSELHKVAFKNDEDGSVEIYFCDTSESTNNANMLFTSNYLNPVATDALLTKLMNESNKYSFLENIGFIGILSDDNNVDGNIEKAFKIFMKRVEVTMKDIKTARTIGHMTEKEFYEKFFSDTKQTFPEEQLLPKQIERRVLRNRQTQPSLIDLTTALLSKTSSEASFHDNESVTSSEFYYFCCSELVEVGQSVEDSYTKYSCAEEHDMNCDRKKFLEEILNLEERLFEWLRHSDFSKFPDEQQIIDSRSLDEMHSDLIDLLNGEEPTYWWKVENTSSYDQTHTNALEYYKEKSASDRGEGCSSRNSTDFPARPQLGRGLKPNENVILGKKPIRLLDVKDYETFESKKKRTSLNQFLFGDLKIKRKSQRSPERQNSTSVIEKSPPPDTIRSRPPIHKFSSRQSLFSRNLIGVGTLGTSAIKEVFMEKQNKPAAESRNEIRLSRPQVIMWNAFESFNRSAKSCFESESKDPEKLSRPTSTKDDKNDVVIVDDDDENSHDEILNGENNDLNNNSPRPKKRQLYNPTPPRRVNKIFKTKIPK